LAPGEDFKPSHSVTKLLVVLENIRLGQKSNGLNYEVPEKFLNICGKIGFLPNGLMHVGAKLMAPLYV